MVHASLPLRAHYSMHNVMECSASSNNIAYAKAHSYYYLKTIQHEMKNCAHHTPLSIASPSNHFKIIHTHTNSVFGCAILTRFTFVAVVPSAFSAVYTHIYRILCVVLNVHAAMYQIAHLKYTKPKPVSRSRTVVNVAFVCAFFSLFSPFCSVARFSPDYWVCVIFFSRFTVHIYPLCFSVS